MNGTRILEREVAGDIAELEHAEAPRGCKVFGTVRTACIRALRLSEDARQVSRQNRVLLITLVVMNVVSSRQDVGEVLAALLKLLGR